MEINREMILLYALGRVQNPDHRALIEHRLANDPEVAGWLEELRNLGQPLPDDDDDDEDIDDLDLDTQGWEDLRYFFPDNESPRNYLPQTSKVDRRKVNRSTPVWLNIPPSSTAGAAASSSSIEAGEPAQDGPGYWFDLKRNRLCFRCPESLASFEHGVGLVQIHASEESIENNEPPLAAAVFPIHPVNGVYETEIPLGDIQPGLVVDGDAEARFSDDTDEILAACTARDLEYMLEEDAYDEQWRRKVASLLKMVRSIS